MTILFTILRILSRFIDLLILVQLQLSFCKFDKVVSVDNETRSQTSETVFTPESRQNPSKLGRSGEKKAVKNHRSVRVEFLTCACALAGFLFKL